MLFFQVLLVGGYAYADSLVRYFSFRWQVIVHVSLLGMACLLLPITPGAEWKPSNSSQPAQEILLLLAACVGLPYLLLSATGPLVQWWYAQMNNDKSPYRFYSLSNVGSLGALLTYPILVEPALTTAAQGVMWSGGFAFFAILCAATLIWVYRSSREFSKEVQGEEVSSNSQKSATRIPSWLQRFLWYFLPAVASVALLSVTNYLCQDIAVVPFLWILPLSLYLLSFIICFDHERWYSRRWFGLATVLGILIICNMMLARNADELFSDYGYGTSVSRFVFHMPVQLTAYLSMLFLICMICHGELVRLKPAPRRLTSFYLSVSIGGAFGGLFVALICPVIFSQFIELNLVIVVAYGMAVALFVIDGWNTWLTKKRLLRITGLLASIAGFFVVVWAQVENSYRPSLAIQRDFYGVLSVNDVYPDDAEHHGRVLFNGNIVHGFQYLAESKQLEPTTYYSKQSGVGLVLTHFPRSNEKGLRVGLIGLGIGTIAAYGKPGDTYRFYEINPEVKLFAERYFSFLAKSAATIEVVLGDARVSLDREPPREFDVLVMDAFSGDAIPTHLLTKEAMEQVYLKHLAEDGVICLHISSRHLDLAPVGISLGQSYGFEVWKVTDDEDAGKLGDALSDWLILSRNDKMERVDEFRKKGVLIRRPDLGRPIWTDQYSNLWQLMEWN